MLGRVEGLDTLGSSSGTIETRETPMTKRKTLHGSVKKIIKPVTPSEPEKAEIDIHEGDELFREIRIENVVTDENGKKDKLQQGEDVDLIVEADGGKRSA